MPIEVYGDFTGGLNLQDHPPDIPKNESPSALNVYGGDNRALKPRKGLGLACSFSSFSGGPHQVTILASFTPRNRVLPPNYDPDAYSYNYRSMFMVGAESRYNFFGDWTFPTWDPYFDFNSNSAPSGQSCREYTMLSQEVRITSGDITSATFKRKLWDGSWKDCGNYPPLIAVDLDDSGGLNINGNPDTGSNLPVGRGPPISAGSFYPCPAEGRNANQTLALWGNVSYNVSGLNLVIGNIYYANKVSQFGGRIKTVPLQHKNGTSDYKSSYSSPYGTDLPISQGGTGGYGAPFQIRYYGTFKITWQITCKR